MSKGKSLGILAALVAAALVFTAVAAGPTLAAKGGGRGGRGGGTPNAGTCSVAPNPAARWTAVTLSGSGYGAYNTIGITVRNTAGDTFGTFATADDKGSFSTTYNTVWLGTNTVSAAGGIGSATCTFEVV